MKTLSVRDVFALEDVNTLPTSLVEVIIREAEQAEPISIKHTASLLSELKNIKCVSLPLTVLSLLPEMVPSRLSSLDLFDDNGENDISNMTLPLLPNLQTLSLHITNTEENIRLREMVYYLIESSPNLKKLDFKFLRFEIAREMLYYFPHLIRTTISFHSMFMPIFKYELIRLLQEFPKLDQLCVNLIRFGPDILPQLRNIRVLDLVRCDQIKLPDFKTLLEDNSKLQILKLHYYRITLDDTLYLLTQGYFSRLHL